MHRSIQKAVKYCLIPGYRHLVNDRMRWELKPGTRKISEGLAEIIRSTATDEEIQVHSPDDMKRGMAIKGKNTRTGNVSYGIVARSKGELVGRIIDLIDEGVAPALGKYTPLRITTTDECQYYQVSHTVFSDLPVEYVDSRLFDTRPAHAEPFTWREVCALRKLIYKSR